LTDPSAPIPNRIIPALEKSRPPVYSPELSALLTSPYSRKTKPLNPRNLRNPPALPPRADPNSEEAKLLGPFSKRRSVNIRHRYFDVEERKVYPPLQIALEQRQGFDPLTDGDSLTQVGIREMGFQGSGIMEEVLFIAGAPSRPPRLTRRERRSLGVLPTDAPSDASPTEVSAPRAQSHLRRRWLRRRYQELLYTLPVLSYTPPSMAKGSGRYSVTLAPSAVGADVRFAANRLPFVDEADMAWVQQGGEPKSKPKK